MTMVSAALGFVFQFLFFIAGQRLSLQYKHGHLNDTRVNTAGCFSRYSEKMTRLSANLKLNSWGEITHSYFLFILFMI